MGQGYGPDSKYVLNKEPFMVYSIHYAKNLARRAHTCIWYIDSLRDKATTIRLLVSHLLPAPIRNSPHGNVINLIISTWSAHEGCAVFSAPIVSG